MLSALFARNHRSQVLLNVDQCHLQGLASGLILVCETDPQRAFTLVQFVETLVELAGQILLAHLTDELLIVVCDCLEQGSIRQVEPSSSPRRIQIRLNRRQHRLVGRRASLNQTLEVISKLVRKSHQDLVSSFHLFDFDIKSQH